MASACVRDDDYTDNREPGLLAVAMRRLVSLVGDTIEDAAGLLIGAAARMVGSIVLKERGDALALRRREVCVESGLVHLIERVQKAAAELSLELVTAQLLVVLARLILRRRALLGEPAEQRWDVRRPSARVGRVRGSAGVRAPDRHDHLAVRERLARGSRVTMALTPRRCRFPRVARVGPHGLRGEREGLAEKIDRAQVSLRAVAQREVLLAEQAHEPVDERHPVQVLAHVSWLAHLAHDVGAALA